MTGFSICKKCVMDSTDPDIYFDGEGVCNHCRRYESFEKRIPDLATREKQLERLIARVKKECADKEYDCILGLSGGVDSSYVAYKAVIYGLRPLVVHFDSGWNTETAVKNIENIVRKLDLDLYTFVVDWEEMKDLQLAYLKASVINADVPQDHAFLTMLYRLAVKKKIKYFLSGYNHQTEFILPQRWFYNTRDVRNIKAIHKRFGTREINNYPMMNKLVYNFIRVALVRKIDLLYYINYNKKEAMEILKKKLDWKYYGAKHHESIWTRFYQSHYLPTKFGVDKRKAHLSSLIVSGQITREEALKELAQEIYPPDLLENDIEFVRKKLGLTEQEYDKIMNAEIKDHSEYGTDWYFQKIIRLGGKIIDRFNIRI